MRTFLRGFLITFGIMILLTINALPLVLVADGYAPDALMAAYYIIIPIDIGIGAYCCKNNPIL